jgi:hypothetical protein
MNFFASCFNDPASSPQYVHELLEKASVELMNSMLRSPSVDRVASHAQVSGTASPILDDSAVLRESPSNFADSPRSTHFGCNNISREVCFLGFHAPCMMENDHRSFPNGLENFTAELALPDMTRNENKFGSDSSVHRLKYTTQAREARTPRSPLHAMQRVRELEKELYISNRRYSFTFVLEGVEFPTHNLAGTRSL